MDEEHVSFHSKQEVVFELTDLEDLYKKMFAKTLESFSTYIKNGSGWTLKSVVKLQITKSKFNLIKGSSYIPLPDVLKTSKTPGKAFTPPAKTKMGTRLERSLGGGIFTYFCSAQRTPFKISYY